MDALADLGWDLRWTDRHRDAAWGPGRWLPGLWGGLVRRSERWAAPWAQAVLTRRDRRGAGAVLAMFESEGHSLALWRSITRWAGGRRRPPLIIVSCWLADLVRHSSPGRLRLYRFVYRGVDRVVVFSANQASTLVDLLGLDESRVATVPFGVDVDEVDGLPITRGSTVVAVGRDRGRDWFTLAEAVRGTGLAVDLVTRPEQVEAVDLPVEVRLHPPLDRSSYLDMLAGAGVVAVPTEVREYPTGQSVLLEAMALGKACVVSDTPALADYVSDGVDAVTVPVGDAAALRTALTTLLADPDRARDLGRRARARVEADHRAPTMWGHIDGVLRAASTGAAGGRPLRILLVMPGVTPDAGAERSLVAVAPHLMAAGLEVHLAVLTGRQDLVGELVSAGVRVHDLSSSPSILARGRALRGTIREVRPDLVHASLFDAALPAQISVLGSRVPILVTWANTLYGPERRTEPGVTPWKLSVVRLVEIAANTLSRAHFHAVTSGVARTNAERLHVRPGRVSVGERGRDPGKFSVRAEDVERTRRSLSLPAGARIVLAVGRQEPQKGYPSLLSAFEKVAAADPDAHLVIAGREGGDSAVLAERRSASPWGDRIHVLGQREDIPQLLHLADVVVCASLREGAAGALIEAMACSAPILSVPLDGLEDVLVDGVNALVSPRDRLPDAIGRLLADRALAARLGAGGRETFLHRFTVERSAARMVEIYRRVADRSPGG